MSTATVPAAETRAPSLPETVVNIAVGRVGDGYRLRVFPQRPGDTIVFHTNPPHARSPERPRTVRWNAYGLVEGQKLVMKEKGTATGIFSSDEFTIEYDSTSTVSSEANRGPSLGSDLSWYYSITLFGSGAELAKVDPVIVIKDDT